MRSEFSLLFQKQMIKETLIIAKIHIITEITKTIKSNKK